MVTLYVRNAFNSLRWTNVLHALEHCFYVLKYLLRMTRDYLSKRVLIIITVLGKVIRTKEEVKYLGITFDTELTFFLHIASAKATHATTVLSAFMSNMSGASQNQILLCGTEV